MLDDLLAGDRRALAKAITLVESTRPDHRAEAAELLTAVAPHTGTAIRVGVSGPPGVGKSTFIESCGLHVLDTGRSVAVLAVDPSSSRSGGSILGDKTRMAELSRHERAFIRPSPSRGDLGGVARRTREALLLCEAAGFDAVLVETVGVGQSEIAVADLVDTFVLLVAAGGGDELQGVKRGIMELADLVVITKADGDLLPAANRAVADHRHAVAFLRRRFEAWEPRVLAVSAVAGHGIAEVWDAVVEHRATLEASGAIEALRHDQAEAWFRAELRDRLLEWVTTDPSVASALAEAAAGVRAGTLDPAAAVESVVAHLRH